MVGSKNDVDVALGKLVEQDGLMHIIARQAVRRMDVEALDAADVDGVAPAFQSRSKQSRSAGAFVEESSFVFEAKAIGGDALFQGGDLTWDRRVVGLTLRTDPGIQGDSSRRIHSARSGTDRWLPRRRRDERGIAVGKISAWFTTSMVLSSQAFSLKTTCHSLGV